MTVHTVAMAQLPDKNEQQQNSIVNTNNIEQVMIISTSSALLVGNHANTDLMNSATNASSVLYNCLLCSSFYSNCSSNEIDQLRPLDIDPYIVFMWF